MSDLNFRASAQHTGDAQQMLVEEERGCMVWLPELSLGTAPPPPAAWQEPPSATKPCSGLAGAGWRVSDHTPLTGPTGLRGEPRGPHFSSFSLAFSTAEFLESQVVPGAWTRGTCLPVEGQPLKQAL